MVGVALVGFLSWLPTDSLEPTAASSASTQTIKQIHYWVRNTVL